MKKIPYGTANYEKIIQNNHYYVDKTKYIEILENLGTYHHFLLRPRRFGKTLFLSVLEHYYDISQKDQFHKLFNDTYIGQNPTPLRNSLPILRFNFSQVSVDGDIKQIQQSFTYNISNGLKEFFYKYKDILKIEVDFEKEYSKFSTATDLSAYFISEMSMKKIKYYLLIDEYDNFANNIIGEYGKSYYQKVTHAGGFLRNFFTVIKAGTEKRTIERFFATGVSPLVLSDVTSGMNMGDNISNNISFNSILGFCEKEVENIVDYYIKEKLVPAKERKIIFKLMKSSYDNYSFSKNYKEKIYNTDMVLYFFKEYLKNKEMPDNIIDANIRTDYAKLKFLIHEGNKLNGNFNVLKEVLKNKTIEGDLAESFSIGEIINKEKFKSLLYYLGFLTIKQHLYTTNYIFEIPNNVVKTLLWEYIRKIVDQNFDLRIDTSFLKNQFNKMAFNGEWKDFFMYLLDKFYRAVSIKDFVFHEEGIKIFLLAYLNFTPLYTVHSEPELNKGFADIWLQKNFYTTDLTKYEYIVELKYIKKEKGKIAQSEIDKQKEDAIEQINRYILDKKINDYEKIYMDATIGNMTCPKLKKLVIVISSDKPLVVEEV